MMIVGILWEARLAEARTLEKVKAVTLVML
jgi:hypothetical protein